MIALTILVCSLGIPPELDIERELCRLYKAHMYVPEIEVPMKVREFCALAGLTAIRHGGIITHCQVVSPKVDEEFLIPEEDSDDRRPGSIRT